ncbi:MAG TPA: alpha/beta hydrolase [Haliangiales bacterium]|nr:alpha/beta hydrolase [Haliangiales bacterium]
MLFAAHGLSMDYEIRGDGRPLLLVHGLAGDRAMLAEACEPAFAEAPGWRRIYLDLPGHGRSPKGAGPGSADALLAVLAAFAREHAPGAALVGHAYGGYLALGLLRELSAVAGAFLVCPVVEPDLPLRRLPPQRVVATEPDLAFADDGERDMFYGAAVVQTKAALAVYRRVVHPAYLAADRGFVQSVRARYGFSGPWAAAAAGFDRPLVVACGRDDFWSGYEDATRILRLCARAELAVLPECGPLLPLEQPARFRGLLRGFLDRVGEEKPSGVPEPSARSR